MSTHSNFLPVESNRRPSGLDFGPRVVWLHGTRAGFTKGGLLLPPATTGRALTTAPVTPGRERPELSTRYVYLTRDPFVAERYAQHATGRGHPKVLTVQPVGIVERDPEHGPNTDAWRCEAATVEKVEVLSDDHHIQDVRAARSHDSSFGLSPQFRKWDQIATGLGVWWQIDNDGQFTIHF